MGADATYAGSLGCGEIVKLVNQLILSVSVAAIAEGLVLGVKGGVEPDVLLLSENIHCGERREKD
jgi:3-hydroxyisobutyrate dehydrogenase-like beta-hydroxyacid dehydrogenase